MFSTMGYAVHKCSRQGTVNAVILFNETPCQCAKHNQQSNSADAEKSANCCSCCCSKEEPKTEESGECKDKCCTTEVFTITHDQVNSQNLYADAPAISDILFDLDIHWISDISTIKGTFSGILYSTGFIKSRLQTSPLSFISQFRI